MSTYQTAEFALDEPKPTKLTERYVYLRDSVRQLIAQEKEHGGLVSQASAARMLKVSPQRICDLVTAGRLVTVDVRDSEGEVMERGLVSVHSIIDYARQAMTNKGGRPKKRG